ncbi:hypothetical protein [Halostreptopolyspora alba]|uniref:Uncharacterized protein n=1 Tax=Halostreptopolyspora alba TaxID=2487137 RepID=A0A3N0DYI3_9ACTN|nr:hypothetical protein EFW17_23180 [Nocardiopsaceae bacterium YIM 96095]
MGADSWMFLGFLAVALALLVVGAYARLRQRDTDPPTGPGPWREGGSYRLTTEEQRTVRRAVRRGEGLEDPRLAEPAWRMAEIAQHNRGQNWGWGTSMAVISAESFVAVGIESRWESVSIVGGHLIAVPLMLLCLPIVYRVVRRLHPNAGRAEDSSALAAARAARANRAVVRAAGTGEAAEPSLSEDRGPRDTCP